MMPGGRPGREQPKPETPLTFASSLKDLGRTLGLVWEASPGRLVLLSSLSLLLAFAPAVSIWISKLLLDAVAGAISGSLGTFEEAFRSLLLLLGLQVGVNVMVSGVST